MTMRRLAAKLAFAWFAGAAGVVFSMPMGLTSETSRGITHTHLHDQAGNRARTIRMPHQAVQSITGVRLHPPGAAVDDHAPTIQRASKLESTLPNPRLSP